MSNILQITVQLVLESYYSLGYQKKGWTSGELGVQWIKDFDRKTKAKARD
jgi:hypothetical protein